MITGLISAAYGAGILAALQNGSPKDQFGALPSTTPAGRQAQAFQSAIRAQQGSPTQINALNQGANLALSRRMAGEDIGEAGFAMIRASRPGYVGGTAGAISSAWGNPWPGKPQALSPEEEADILLSEEYGGRRGRGKRGKGSKHALKRRLWKLGRKLVQAIKSGNQQRASKIISKLNPLYDDAMAQGVKLKPIAHKWMAYARGQGPMPSGGNRRQRGGGKGRFGAVHRSMGGRGPNAGRGVAGYLGGRGEYNPYSYESPSGLHANFAHFP